MSQEEQTNIEKGIAGIVRNQGRSEINAQISCNHITHVMGTKVRLIIWVVLLTSVILGCNSIRMHYSWKSDVDKANKLIGKLQKDLKNGKNNREVVVWFDKQRQYSDKNFEQIDIKYPAQYERWAADGSVIERWHWRVEGQPETYRFGDKIQRCVAIYKQGNFVGYRAYSMETYPTDDWKPAAANKVKEDSLVLRVIGSRKEISHYGGIGWSMIFEEGKFKCLKKKDLNGVVKTYEPDLLQAVGMFNLVEYDRNELIQIASENEDLKELHLIALKDMPVEKESDLLKKHQENIGAIRDHQKKIDDQIIDYAEAVKQQLGGQ